MLQADDEKRWKKGNKYMVSEDECIWFFRIYYHEVNRRVANTTSRCVDEYRELKKKSAGKREIDIKNEINALNFFEGFAIVWKERLKGELVDI